MKYEIQNKFCFNKTTAVQVNTNVPLIDEITGLHLMQ